MRDETPESLSKDTAATSVRVTPNGPFLLDGRLSIELEDGGSAEYTSVALCRCGNSESKPFCDGRHAAGGFADDAMLNDSKLRGHEAGSPTLEVRLAANGPILLSGPLTITGSGASEAHVGTGGALCRCGASKNKPYCDGSHREIGFES